ncbi:hypothetical protein AB6M97_01875 [Streptococcus hillyeri]|uniref:hypothetical protein n=1 Tax=Streptococcus hillyeri TaxID=2282420 RepID=UPI0034E2CB23
MEHNTELNHMINSLFRIEKWHLYHFREHNPEKFEQLVRYHLRKNHFEESTENIEYVRKKLGTKSNYGIKRRDNEK